MRYDIRSKCDLDDGGAHIVLIVNSISVGTRPAQGQGRLVPGKAALILALRFGQGR